jgi:CubicO group peptidase (beta-lactamase class C family)
LFALIHFVLASVFAVRIASLTKLMTTQLLVNLVGQGVVRYDTPLEKCMPGFSIRTLPEQKTRNGQE